MILFNLSSIWLLPEATPVHLYRRSSREAVVEAHGVSTGVAPGRSQLPTYVSSLASLPGGANSQPFNFYFNFKLIKLYELSLP